ncbi:ferredoxin--NADP+ reductase [Galdieria sulphuraria]|uniref:NADPH:adrenodoxin oxidoreductase, mitochondrial n=1 Tax=Galdieria sulphuraria TaxID=130081 RepID=M2Y8R1_GALSU|nr:ferredoxin--NADP+ reductase [Galdieria sulphuraria]EME32453.1 ferredoxin--NADP+ reductase [Galdieria sulphuraria]|eukprot:XP_005708973.1 ferredoxin--NADP+ reductase [Galdieria sulphuraria]
MCRYANTAASEFRTCVVGSGPAAMYTTECLLRFQAANPFISNRLVIDVLERLPTPFGLLRYGVAPDHPEVRKVEVKFQDLLSHPQVRFFGNVEIGKDVLVSELKNLYDAVILAAGCQEERKLGIPGENTLSGIYSARDFVAWYCGHPDYSQLWFDFASTKDVVIIGQGNVALDLARIIGKQVESLRTTDISSIALECLANSSVQNIHVIGRRGPVQASWTAKELRECLFSVKSLQPCFETQELVISDVDREELNTSRTTRRCYDLLTKCFAERSVSQQEVFSRKLHLRFLWTPISFQSLDENSELDYAFGKALRFTELRRNRLTGSSGKQKAVLLEDSVGDVNWKQQCELAFRSIGYKGKSFEGVPFDEKAGVVPNKLGRVVSRVEESLNSCEEPASYETGLYVVGWLKRGPTGIIGSNKWDAEETVKAVVDDFLSKLKTKRCEVASKEDMLTLLLSRNVAFVDFKGWKRIDEEERKRGQRRGIEREKILTWEELLELGAVRTTSKAYGKEPELLSKK